MNEKWYLYNIRDIEKKLNTDAASGLSRKAARSRLEKGGKNDFFLSKKKSTGDFITEIMFDPSMLLLALTAVIAAIFSYGDLALITLGILAFNMTRIINSYIKAHRIIEATALYSQPQIKVLRSGRVFLVDSRSVVPGDVIFFNEGDIIPCDARLLSTSSLEILTYICADQKNGKYVKVPKRADAVYIEPFENIIENAENMIFAGSVVSRGSGRAIVTSTGKNTYNGAYIGGIEIGETTGELKALADVKRYCTKYSLYILLSILPVSIIGIIVARESFDLLEVFMIALSLSASAMSEMLSSFATVVVSRGIVRAGKPKLNSAIIKSVTKIDALTNVDMLFLLGKSSLSDGRLHIERVYEDGELSGEGEIFSPAACETIKLAKLFYSSMNSSPALTAKEKDAFFAAFEEYEKSAKLDTRELFYRYKTGSYIPPTRGNEYIGASAVFGSNKRFVIFNSSSKEIIRKCRFIRVHGDEKLIFPKLSDDIIDTFDALVDDGYTVSVFATKDMNGLSLSSNKPYPDGLTLEGMFIYREYVNKDIDMTLEALADAGITSRVFLPDESVNSVSFLKHAGIIEEKSEIAFASDFKRSGSNIFEDNALMSYKAFLGFSYDDIYGLVRDMQSRGNTVACEGMLHREYMPLYASDVMIVCDTVDYNSKAKVDMIAEDINADGLQRSRRAAETMKKNADVLIKRSTRYGGGINGILTAIIQSIGIYRNLLNVVRYLVCSFLMRFFAVIPPLLGGVCLLSPTQILVCGLFIDGYAIYVLASDEPKEFINKGKFDYRTEFSDLFRRNTNLIICSAICGSTIWALMLIFHFCGLTGGLEGARAFAFIALIVLQITVFVLIRRRIIKSSFSIRPNRIGFISLGVLIGFIAISFIVKPIGNIVGISGLTLPCILALPVIPAILIILYFTVCKRNIEH